MENDLHRPLVKKKKTFHGERLADKACHKNKHQHQLFLVFLINFREIKEAKNVSLNHFAFPMPDMIYSEINNHQQHTDVYLR